MKKIKYSIFLFLVLTLTSCQSVEVISIKQKQEKISLIRDYILKQSIYNLDATTYDTLTLSEIIGEANEHLDLVKNELPYLNANLSTFSTNIHLSYKKSLFEIQELLLTYGEKIEYPLIYPNVNNKYIINEKSSSILLNQYRDELYLEIENLLEKNLYKASSLYTSMAKEYNIYCQGLTNLNRQSLPLISTNIMPRLKTIFIRILIDDLSKNENNLNLINVPIDPIKINLNRD